MTQFSKADAEAAGWVFTHADPGRVDDLGDGNTKTIEPSYVAEKALPGGGLITEQGHSEEILVERIALYEEHLVQKGVDQSNAGQAAHQDAEAAAQAGELVVTDLNTGATKLIAPSVNDAIYDGKEMTHVVAGEVAKPADGAWAQIDADRGIVRGPEAAPAAETPAEEAPEKHESFWKHLI